MACPAAVIRMIGQLQLLAVSAVAFAVLIRYGVSPAQLRATNLDFDWVYRRFLPLAIARTWDRVWRGWILVLDTALDGMRCVLDAVRRHHEPEGVLARTWPLGSTTLWVAVLLGVFLLIYYL